MKYTKVYAKHDYIATRYKSGERKYKYIIHKGSSRSSKTVSIIQWIDRYCTENSNTRATVWRDTRSSLASTVWSDYEKYFGSKHRFTKHATPIHFNNGSTFEPHGADSTNAHGLTQNIAWLNEPYKITKSVFDQIDQRADLIIIDWNPKQGHWIDDLSKHSRSKVIHSTYKDNPFCPPEQRKKIESYEPTPENIVNGTADKYMWDVYGLGVKAEKPNRIYHGWNFGFPLNEYLDLESTEYYGQDFGSTNPAALVGVKVKDNNLYVRELFYKAMSNEMSYSELWESKGIEMHNMVVCDSAGKDIIDTLYTGGYYAIGAKKGPGSVTSGIKFMREMNIFVVDGGENIKFEYENYEWEVDRYDLVTEKPIKKDDHAMDAIRYVLMFLKDYLGI